MSADGKGWVGSIAVHLGILAAIIGFSWYAARHPSETIYPEDPLLVRLDGIPNKRPGEIGKAAGVAKGAETGSDNGIARIKVPKLNVEKILREREEAEHAGQSSAASPKSLAKNSPKGSASPGKSGKTTLSEFNQGKSGRAGSGAKSGGIGGVSVKKGRSYGTGDNGGEGGAGSAQALYAGEVQARLRTAWNEVVAAEGASVANGGTCGVTVAVDASGFVTFATWLRRPADPRMQELVRRACGMIGNCGRPPDGKSFRIDFASVSLSDG
ncbi:MAG: hypothetical protein RIS38_337 [Verrucomicrobiota bacterium]|jgi:hypothetical protein